jgi:hypothetical protein
MSRHWIPKKADRLDGVLLDTGENARGKIVSEWRAHFEPTGAVNLVHWTIHLGWSPPEEWTRLNVDTAEALQGALRRNIDFRRAQEHRRRLDALSANDRQMVDSENVIKNQKEIDAAIRNADIPEALRLSRKKEKEL